MKVHFIDTEDRTVHEGAYTPGQVRPIVGDRFIKEGVRYEVIRCTFSMDNGNAIIGVRIDE